MTVATAMMRNLQPPPLYYSSGRIKPRCDELTISLVLSGFSDPTLSRVPSWQQN